MTEAVAREVLRVEHLVKHFPVKRGIKSSTDKVVRAVDDVSFTISQGETLGLVGESGCGKTTTGHVVVRLIKETSGTVVVDGEDITDYNGRRLKPVRTKMQIVFQDPFASLNPRRSVGFIVGAPLQIHGQYDKSGPDRVAQLLELVGLNADDAERYPHEFSGGQRQRIGIARALALEPRLLILDEPVSALDVSIQASVINLLLKLQQDLGLAYLFISHDLSVVQHVSNRIAVMYLGKIVEIGTRNEILRTPTHPFTQALLAAVPNPDPANRSHSGRLVLTGDVPSPSDPPSGCRFRTRCWKAADICAEEEPALIDRLDPGHAVACHFPEPSEQIVGAPGRRSI